MNRSESKYFNTALCMDDALIALLAVKDLEYITVKEICKKAGVNRSTFYLHYDSVNDLVNEAIQSVDKRFVEYFAQGNNDLADKIKNLEPGDLIFITKDYLEPYLRYIRENKKVYCASFRCPGAMRANIRYNNLKQYIIEPVLEKFNVPKERWEYYIAYYVEGIIAIIKQWLNNDCRDTVELITAIIEECVRPVNDKMVKTYGG